VSASAEGAQYVYKVYYIFAAARDYKRTLRLFEMENAEHRVRILDVEYLLDNSRKPGILFIHGIVAEYQLVPVDVLPDEGVHNFMEERKLVLLAQ